MKSVASKELRELDAQQRLMKIYALRNELLQLRLKAATGHVAAFATLRRALRKSVARALTIERELQILG